MKNKSKCTLCKSELSLDSFHKNKNRKNGVSAHCKECECKRQRATYASNTKYVNPIYQNIPQNDRMIVKNTLRLNQYDVTVSVYHGWQLGYFQNQACLHNAKTIFVPESLYFLSNPENIVKVNNG